MPLQVDSLPDVNQVQDVAKPNLVTVATLRVVTTRRRLDRFWQMIRDEAPNCYEVGTYNIGDELDLKLVVVEVKKPANEAFLTDHDIHVFPKYRFDAKQVDPNSSPLDLGKMGTATPYNYVAPQPKNTVGDGFV